MRDEVVDMKTYLQRLADELAIGLAAAVDAKLDRNENRFHSVGC